MRFWREFGRCLGWIIAVYKRFSVFGKAVSGLLSVLGLGTVIRLALWTEEVTVPAWGIAVGVLVLLFLLYCAVAGGLAHERASRPLVEVGPLVLDAKYRTFSLRVKNICKVPVKPKVSVTRIEDADGEAVFLTKFDAHWRTKPNGYEMVLAGAEVADAGPLQVIEDNHPKGTPAGLYVAPSEGALIPISRTSPLLSKQQFRVFVTVVCETLQGEYGTPIERVYRIETDLSAPMQYRVIPD